MDQSANVGKLDKYYDYYEFGYDYRETAVALVRESRATTHKTAASVDQQQQQPQPQETKKRAITIFQ